jgi:hypothetical protein
MSAGRLKALIEHLAPASALAAYRRARIEVRRRANARRPARDVFSEVYAQNRWGGAPGEFCSGSGSASSQTSAYASMVRAFVADHHLRTIVDLGCGDYRVGQLLRQPGDRYVGVDIVPGLVEHNRVRFGGPETEFLCLDISTDELPPGDLALVRQVLQHLSNAEIAAVLQKIRRYPFVLVTEHHPAPERLVRPNGDKPHGGDTRIIDGSGVYLEEPPFRCAVECVLESPAEKPLVATGESIRTFLLRT